MKVVLDRTKCIGCGTCWALCGKVFDGGEDGKSHLKGVKLADKQEIETKEQCVIEARDACPTGAISIQVSQN